MSESLNYIEAYFTGQLSDTEKNQFERQIESDEDFAEDVAIYITSRQAIRETLLDEKKLIWAAADARPDEIIATPPRAKKIQMNRWMTYAVAACLFLAISFYFLNIYNSPERLAGRYFKENYSSLGKTMAGVTDSLQMGIEAYNVKQYGKSLVYFEQLYRSHPENSDVILNSGLAYLQLKEYDKAITFFDKLAGLDLHSNKGLFLKALTLLQRNRTGDKVAAKTILQQVDRQSLAGDQQAREWLSHFD